MAYSVKAVGLEGILKKLDVDYLTEDAKRTIFRETAEVARDYLSQNVPRDTGASARTMGLDVRDAGYSIQDAGARLSITANPLKYIEFGTKRGATKSIIRRGGRSLVRTSGGEQRIKKRRFMAKTIGRARSDMKKRVQAAVAGIEARWAK